MLAACPAALAQANTKAMEDLAALERTLSRPLPVYPGAKLDFEDATERHCCAFSTRDAVGKVTGFYERTVKATVLDLPGLLKKYPELAKTAALKEQPPGMTLRYVVLAEIAEGGRRAVDAMEVVCAGGTCRFQVASKRLLPADQHFQDEWKAHFAQAKCDGRHRAGPARQGAAARRPGRVHARAGPDRRGGHALGPAALGEGRRREAPPTSSTWPT